MWLTSLKQSLVELAFPKICVSCRKPGSLICDTCWSDIHLVYTQICPTCQRPSIGGLTHPPCRSPHNLDGVVSLAYYQGPIRQLIRQLKYHGATVTTEAINQVITHYLKHENIHLPPAILTPIPLHQQSRNQRRFNQSLLIANQLSGHLQLPVLDEILVRAKRQPSQTRFSRSERQANIRGAFAVHDRQAVRGASFILVDDVITTGSTIKEAAKVLKRAGARQVWGLTLAREK